MDIIEISYKNRPDFIDRELTIEAWKEETPDSLFEFLHELDALMEQLQVLREDIKDMIDIKRRAEY